MSFYVYYMLKTYVNHFSLKTDVFYDYFLYE